MVRLAKEPIISSSETILSFSHILLYNFNFCRPHLICKCFIYNTTIKRALKTQVALYLFYVRNAVLQTPNDFILLNGGVCVRERILIPFLHTKNINNKLRYVYGCIVIAAFIYSRCFILPRWMNNKKKAQFLFSIYAKSIARAQV